MLNDLNLPSVLSIAGTDPSGGAGIQADIKAISATGSYAASVITVLVAQNTQGVRAIQEIPLAFLQKQMDAVFTDLQFAAVKLGMLYSQEIIELVAQNVKKYQPPLMVLDPVMTTQSGDVLLKPNTIKALLSLFPLVTLITPNIPEAEILLNKKISNKKEMEAAAIALAETHQTSVLLKGGHLTTRDSPDIFYNPREAKIICFDSPRIDTPHTHGTGCTLSSAIASYLAQGYTLYDAIHKAKSYLQQAIAAGKNLKIGKGSGPVHHFYYLKKANHVIQ
ncbi:bifunctional hydroxymethylpyrimidine kinase/phosphomethylpyrimidine kinase [Rickettsiella endosymbiont of Dermanyssus gallinae]|uniref:bifunctional hydroxymethylpyrimidine kinase/phosphomethylpyrimidine kinase n=1 Tax=Rickettsiella endosymbiont of Dermanyssus gallinae TaxID=2856608 RepID=UPI001C52D11C|nr:bifunctional hydroxymethylpyrimidine kinase/phosphomethylpyrimidine kinase [Rickettsiella endosymbiont of Dermanyssus gallinae]